jgi:sodium-dependent dicarboxylate transporter 2/3/5
MGYLNDAIGLEISFGQWMSIGLPVVFIMVPAAWFILTRLVFKTHTQKFNADDGNAVISDRLKALGRMTIPEKRTLMVFAVVAFAWAYKNFLKGISIEDILLFPFLQNMAESSFGKEALLIQPLGFLTDSITAIFGVILCFLVPAGSKDEPRSMVLDWKSAESIPWGPLLLFGGGMSLAFAVRTSGLADWVGLELAGLSTLPTLWLVILITTFVIFITELMSNVATASTLMPILGATALASGLDVELIALPIAMAASCAFMLPTATGPNAVVFASGEVTLPTMVKAGFAVNCAAIPIITVFSMLLTPVIFG